jgi:ABC-type molybdate transport system, periplasmic component
MRIAIALLCALCSRGSLGSEVTVMSGGAVKSAFVEAAAAWRARSGHSVDATYAPAGDLRRKIAAGERADVLIVPAENLDAFAREGVVDSPRAATWPACRSAPR